MPDNDGKLTEEEKQRILNWTKEHWKGQVNCPICASPNWIIGDHVVLPITLGKDSNLMLGGPGYPQVMLVSQPCGYTIFFNAVVIGIAPGAQKTADQKP